MEQIRTVIEEAFGNENIFENEILVTDIKIENRFIDTENTITMVAKNTNNISLRISGYGKAIIDWGNEIVETIELSSRFFSNYSHNYSDTLCYVTITITGAITGFDCAFNRLISLDVSECITLVTLHCQGNKLVSLDVSQNINLEHLVCSNNQLASLDVSKNTALIELHCYGNQLTSLDISNNTKLTRLWCYNNQLTSLDVSNNTVLRCFDVRNNLLSTAALNDLFNTLHDNPIPNKQILIQGNPGTNRSKQRIAKNKGWRVSR